MNSCAIIIPIYRLPLEPFEKLNIKVSLSNLKGHSVFVIGPRDLDLSELIDEFRILSIERFENDFFKSVSSYSKLMLSKELYLRFRSKFTHILICQTDAVILKPELNHWLSQPYDYIGAPWINGYELKISTNSIPIPEGILCKAFIGNGGLSLRNIDSCLSLFNEFNDVHLNWIEAGHAEDLFFGFLGPLSKNFILPHLMKAAQFSQEKDADYLFKLIGNEPPFGVHGFDKYKNHYIHKYLTIDK